MEDLDKRRELAGRTRLEVHAHARVRVAEDALATLAHGHAAVEVCELNACELLLALHNGFQAEAQWHLDRATEGGCMGGSG